MKKMHNKVSMNKVELKDSGMLTTAEVANLLHVHPNTIRQWANNGLIRTYRLGPRGDRRFKLEDVDSFLQQDGE